MPRKKKPEVAFTEPDVVHVGGGLYAEIAPDPPKKAKKAKKGARTEPRPPFEDFPDETLQHPTGSTLASEPECYWCDGLIWAGDVIVALNKSKVAHLTCFEMNARPPLVSETRGRIGKKRGDD